MRQWAAWGCGVLPWWPAFGQGLAGDRLAVIYPEIGEPFRAVFAKILEGIDERAQQRVPRIAVAADADALALASELRRRELKVVIALGRAGLRVATALDPAIEVVAGGVISPNEADARAATLLSLAPDPLLLMQRLKSLQPGVKRVTVVYSPRHSAWLMRHAQPAARQLGLELRALEVDELKSALRQYQDFFAQAAPQDALWLPQDPLTVDESAVLPLVLQECWNRNLALFSSNLGHVRRGALFSLYPNNLELGRSLASSALAQLARQAGAPRGAQPLRDVHAALNTRTASHLGLDLSPQVQRSFELLLPER
ncbi:ABC transporter substrate binding protein [Paucibacter sediminis]|uniref:ABC transporter substrate binding protein n=1 Tax=Paucibacter sediminis TaxID=3019553 RepID=A0AA95NGN7_9BURK|nr:ABC transporter substrate binding protein [Paucibacter sp. S2-9]WIT13183.1 ABC transporter substrate binding protein [Paucibacter sp. S2-9]